MCRMLSYLGKPIAPEELLYRPDNSFIKQTYNPKYMTHLLNLAGFGLVAWNPNSHNPQIPYIYKSTQLPFYDENLWNFANKIVPTCFLAHIRGVSYSEDQVVSNQNVHPFIFEGAPIALAHNGVLVNFEAMKFDLLAYIDNDYQSFIQGTTDSEWIYAVLLTQMRELDPNQKFATNDIIQAILQTLKIIQKVRLKHDITIASPVNLFITNGEFIAATRFVYDFGWQPENAPPSTHFVYHSLWYTYGESYGYHDNQYKMHSGKKKSSLILASEPLTLDNTTWMQVPEYTLLVARKSANEDIEITTKDIIL